MDYKNTPEGRTVQSKYGKILHASRPEPPHNHPRMPMSNRAKIFSPFAALRGYEDEIASEGRDHLKGNRIELSESPHIHGYQRVHIHNYAVCLCSICSLHDVLGLHNLSQVVILVHLADTTSHTAIIRQGILQHKACHTGFSAIHQILMNSLESFLAIVIVCVNDDERSFNYVLRCKHGLTGSPRFCTACWKFSRNIVDILKCVVHSYIMSGANRSNRSKVQRSV